MKKYLPAILLIILGILTRFVPHLPNFTAIGAIAIFAGRYLPKKYALIIPLFAMLVSDIFIGFYSLPIMFSVYFSFAVMNIIGYATRQKNITFSVGGAIIGSIIFFAITNWAVWVAGTMYTHNLSGLATSYYLALPFFRNQLIADIFYTIIMVGGYEMAMKLVKQNKIILENK